MWLWCIVVLSANATVPVALAALATAGCMTATKSVDSTVCVVPDLSALHALEFAHAFALLVRVFQGRAIMDDRSAAAVDNMLPALSSHVQGKPRAKCQRNWLGAKLVRQLAARRTGLPFTNNSPMSGWGPTTCTSRPIRPRTHPSRLTSDSHTPAPHCPRAAHHRTPPPTDTEPPAQQLWFLSGPL